ncbi:MAG TPA: hypothetical protein VMI94_25290 [Bryobacteraceae bacterium]|nr:hypothetical protein [Bryobacteraceae bacterium]
MPYRHLKAIASQFEFALTALAVDARGQLHAGGDRAVEVYDGDGRRVGRWAASRQVCSLTVAADGTVYVGEERQIEIFSGAGQIVRTLRHPKLAGRVTSLGFSGDDLLAGDTWDRAIQRFDRTGTFLNSIGKDNPVNGLLIPNGAVDFAVALNRTIFAANPGKHRVERYSPAGGLLGHCGRFDGRDPAGFTGCCNPTNVAIGGALFTTEKAGPRVKAYDFDGRLLGVLATDLFDPNCKNMDVAVSPAGAGPERVYVADTVRRTIQVFEAVNS